MERRTNCKFLGDKVFVNNPDFLVVTDGVILNKTDLLNQYAAPSLYDLICISSWVMRFSVVLYQYIMG